MLDHLSKAGEIIHLRNDVQYDDPGIQFAALKRADREKAVNKPIGSCIWILTNF